MNNFDTVREALKLATDGPIVDRDGMMAQAIAALAQIEADHFSAADMADAQAKAFREGVASVQQGEPVHWRAVLDSDQAPHQLKTSMHVVGFRNKQAAEGFVAEQADFYNWRYTIEPLYAAPVAQQPVMVDMVPPATARDRWMYEQGRLAERDARTHAAQQPQSCKECNGTGRVSGSQTTFNCPECAQQPRPDFTDEWTGYLKDGETPFERFMRERKDLGALTKLYQRALEENERLKAQQPQAEAVPAWTTEQITAVARPIAMAIAENCRTAPQLVFPHLFLGLKDLLTGTAPQQAEAVPSDVVRDAAPIPDHELVTMYDERPTSDLEMIEFAREVERRHGIGVQPKHITDGSPCWCNPDVAYADPETGASVIVHRRPQ